MSISKEPVCCRYDEDRLGAMWIELVSVDRLMDREDRISYWMEIPEVPNE